MKEDLEENSKLFYYDDYGWIARNEEEEIQNELSNAEFVRPFQIVWTSIRKNVTKNVKKGFAVVSSHPRRPIMIIGSALAAACIILRPALAKGAISTAEKTKKIEFTEFVLQRPIEPISIIISRCIKPASVKIVLIYTMIWGTKKIMNNESILMRLYKLFNRFFFGEKEDIPRYIPERINDWEPPIRFRVPHIYILPFNVIFVLFLVYKNWLKRNKNRQFVSFKDFLRSIRATLRDPDFLKPLKKLFLVQLALLGIIYTSKIPLENFLNNAEFRKLLDQNLEKVKTKNSKLADMLVKQAIQIDPPEDDLMKVSPVNRYIYREFLKILRRRPAPGVVLNALLKKLG